MVHWLRVFKTGQWSDIDPSCDIFYIRDPNQNLLKNQYCLIDDIYFAIDIDLDMVTPYQHLVKCNGYIDSYHNIMLDKEGWVLKI